MNIRTIEDRVVWSEGKCSITQTFALQPPPMLAAETLVERLDAIVMQRTSAAGLGLMRWRRGELRLGPLCLLRLAQLRERQIGGFTLAAGREILGGLIAPMGGLLWYGVLVRGQRTIVAAQLRDFKPRLPQFAFDLLQAPLHRRVIRQSVRTLADPAR